MTGKLQIYRCPVCDTVVEVLERCGMELVCCGPAMVQMREKTVDRGRERHVPVVEINEVGVTVRVGDMAHPMDDQHRVEWIEILFDGKCYRQFLSPGDLPEATFHVRTRNVVARAYCNTHGLWKSQARQPSFIEQILNQRAGRVETYV